MAVPAGGVLWESKFPRSGGLEKRIKNHNNGYQQTFSPSNDKRYHSEPIDTADSTDRLENGRVPASPTPQLSVDVPSEKCGGASCEPDDNTATLSIDLEKGWIANAQTHDLGVDVSRAEHNGVSREPYDEDDFYESVDDMREKSVIVPVLPRTGRKRSRNQRPLLHGQAREERWEKVRAELDDRRRQYKSNPNRVCAYIVDFATSHQWTRELIPDWYEANDYFEWEEERRQAEDENKPTISADEFVQQLKQMDWRKPVALQNLSSLILGASLKVKRIDQVLLARDNDFEYYLEPTKPRGLVDTRVDADFSRHNELLKLVPVTATLAHPPITYCICIGRLLRKRIASKAMDVETTPFYIVIDVVSPTKDLWACMYATMPDDVTDELVHVPTSVRTSEWLPFEGIDCARAVKLMRLCDVGMLVEECFENDTTHVDALLQACYVDKLEGDQVLTARPT